ncbi:FlgN protein [Botrimarina colliarenosi]|uniref:FlgN protein n=1 Tax=Botrimarina colliarenosi TaxID=2528001 RepID=A0A5C6AH99_9BACT|nr:flagellar protein FlgN [Botrimarina colliarenosi]TWT99364.1 FlgN protein [Botrimarina colliarenosi]
MTETSDSPRFDTTTFPTTLDGWEGPLSQLLADLSATQTELLDVLGRKRDLLVSGDREGLAAIGPEEQQLSVRLAECQQRRQGMLDAAAERGLPNSDLRSLADELPDATRKVLRPKFREAQNRARLLQHQSLANWVIVQRTLLHLSQMIEIVATGGQKSPTYEKSGPSKAGGVLMDRAV